MMDLAAQLAAYHAPPTPQKRKGVDTKRKVKRKPKPATTTREGRTMRRTTKELDFGAFGDRQVTVTYNYFDALRGNRTDPPEPASVEIVGVSMKTPHGTLDISKMLSNEAYFDLQGELIEDNAPMQHAA